VEIYAAYEGRVIDFEEMGNRELTLYLGKDEADAQDYMDDLIKQITGGV
jgi:hypothetical protein